MDIVERLFESDAASALTNEAARFIEAQQKTIDKYKTALEKIAKPTYGTEFSNTDEENAEIISGHFFRVQNIAREAIDYYV